MPSRRRYLAACCAGASLSTAGCLAGITRPDIPREATVIDDRRTIDAGGFHVWPLAERVENAPVSPVDDQLVFSYEFDVERGPAVTLAVTTGDEVDRRAEADAHYQVFAGTRSYGRHGHASESMSVSLLDRFVADAQYVGPDTPPDDRDAATVRVQAYLSVPDER